jgi:peptidoglycan-N-acetylglucosamine deacetylase
MPLGDGIAIELAGDMKILFLLLVLGLQAHARQYPEEREYSSEDKGYKQYGAPSLHHTGRYALTYDDGPHPVRTPKILDILRKYNVKATFFVVTSTVNKSNFPIIKRILDEGHLLASHGRFHDNSNKITKEQWKTKVKQSFIDLAALYKKAGYEFDKHFYRFPYAAYGERKDHHHMNSLRELSRELMGDNCIHFAFWDIDSGDWIPGMNGAEVADNIKAAQEGGKFITYKTIRKNGKLTQVKVSKVTTEPTSGGVILQHDIQESSVKGTELFLKYATASGLELIRLDEVQEFLVTKNCKIP